MMGKLMHLLFQFWKSSVRLDCRTEKYPSEKRHLRKEWLAAVDCWAWKTRLRLTLLEAEVLHWERMSMLLELKQWLLQTYSFLYPLHRSAYDNRGFQALNGLLDSVQLPLQLAFFYFQFLDFLGIGKSEASLHHHRNTSFEFRRLEIGFI